MAAARANTLLQHRLPNGLQLYVQAQTDLRQAHAAWPLSKPRAVLAEPAPVAAKPGPLPAAARRDDGAKLREANLHLIATTLAACGGNVSRAARELGVSRGLVYRHLKLAGTTP